MSFNGPQPTCDGASHFMLSHDPLFSLRHGGFTYRQGDTCVTSNARSGWINANPEVAEALFSLVVWPLAAAAFAGIGAGVSWISEKTQSPYNMQGEEPSAEELADNNKRPRP